MRDSAAQGTGPPACPLLIRTWRHGVSPIGEVELGSQGLVAQACCDEHPSWWKPSRKEASRSTLLASCQMAKTLAPGLSF